MKIAVTSQNRRDVTSHAGRCRRFWVYDLADGNSIQDRQLLELPKEQAMHETAVGAPHPLDGVDVLISGGMGDGMRRKLQGRGIQAVTTSCADPDAAVQGWISGTLPPVAQTNDASAHHCHCGH